MSTDRILTWVNGEIHDPADAKISIFDRGFLFGDSVYELTRFFDGEGVGFDLHVERLERSMSETGITGFKASDYRSISSDLMQALGIGDACIYIQVTVSERLIIDHNAFRLYCQCLARCWALLSSAAVK